MFAGTVPTLMTVSQGLELQCWPTGQKLGTGQRLGIGGNRQARSSGSEPIASPARLMQCGSASVGSRTTFTQCMATPRDCQRYPLPRANVEIAGQVLYVALLRRHRKFAQVRRARR